MLPTVRILGALALLLPLLAATPARARATDPMQAIERWRTGLFNRVAPSVVLISGGSGFGSGFFVGRGLVLTNAHVVGQKRQVKVVLHDGRKLSGLVIERAAGKVDLALVRVSAQDVPPLAIGAVSTLKVGSWVGSVGHGRGTIWSFNTGMVSNIYRSGNSRPVFQTQIPLNPGSSGAPVFDRQGKVVGVVTAGIQEANSINFAIKIDVAFKRLKHLRGRRGQLTILAPAGTPVMVDGKMVGTGPRVVIRVSPRRYEISAVVRGQLKKVVVHAPRKRHVDLR